MCTMCECTVANVEEEIHSLGSRCVCILIYVWFTRVSSSSLARVRGDARALVSGLRSWNFESRFGKLLGIL